MNHVNPVHVNLFLLRFKYYHKPLIPIEDLCSTIQSLYSRQNSLEREKTYIF